MEEIKYKVKFKEDNVEKIFNARNENEVFAHFFNTEKDGITTQRDFKNSTGLCSDCVSKKVCVFKERSDRVGDNICPRPCKFSAIECTYYIKEVI